MFRMMKAAIAVLMLIVPACAQTIGDPVTIDVTATVEQQGWPDQTYVRVATGDAFIVQSGTADNWKVYENLYVDMTGNTSGIAFRFRGPTHYVRFQNITVKGGYNAFMNTFDFTMVHTDPNKMHHHLQWKHIETSGQSNKAFFIGGDDMVFDDVYAHDCASHILRLWHACRTEVKNSRLEDTLGTNAAVIKLHNDVKAGLDMSYDISIHDNHFRGKAPWDVTIGTQDSISDELTKKVEVYKNVWELHPEVQIGCRISAQDVDFHDNTADWSGHPLKNKPPDEQAHLVSVERWGVEPPPTGCTIGPNNVAIDAQVLKNKWIDTVVIP